jgi:hypothetical protein
MSGLDLLTWAATTSPKTRVIIMTAFDAAQVEDRAQRLGCLKVVQKPFELKRMRELIQPLLDDDGSLGGSLGSLSPADVIQMLCLSHRTTALRVVDGPRSGLLHIVRGEIVHAVWENLVGEEAVYRLLRSTRGMFTTIPLLEAGPHTVNGGWQQLLIEGMRRDDEGIGSDDDDALAGLDALGTDPVPPPAPAPEPGPWPAVEQRQEPDRGGKSPRAADLIDEGFRCLRRKEYDRARELWQNALALEPGNRMLELNLRKLDALAR